MSDDFPKYWTEEEVNPETGEIYDNSSALMPVVKRNCKRSNGCIQRKQIYAQQPHRNEYRCSNSCCYPYK